MTKKQSVAEKRAHLARVQERHCPQAGRTVDRRNYPTIAGMHAAERVEAHAGRILYWDPTENAWYDRKSDLYVW